MGLLQRIRQWQDARHERKAHERMEKLAAQIVPLAEARDFHGMKGLLDKYRYSQDIVCLMTEHLAKHDLIRTPEEAADREVLAMIESLKKSDHALRAGVRLAYIPSDSIGAIHRIVAMHTFLLDEYRNSHPESETPRPERSDTNSAKRILSCCRKDRDARELTMLAVHGTEPSEYVKLRYRLKEDYSILNRICQGENFEQTLSGKAADILEQKFENNLPKDFVTAMEHDREVLRLFASKPDSDRHLRIFAPCNRFELLPRETPEDRRVRIAEAYARLDLRIARMTGEKPLLPCDVFLNKPLFEEALRRKDYFSLCDLVRLNRDNVPLVREWTGQLAGAHLFDDIQETRNPLLGSLADQLNITRYGQETGIIPEGKDKEVSPLHLINACYTVMRHEHSLRLERVELPVPTPEELRTAVQVLDSARRGIDRDELRRTFAGEGEPSGYVKVRYGLSDSYQKVDYLLDMSVTEILADRFPSAASLKEKADKVNENIRQMAGSLAQGISEGKMPDSPLDVLCKDKEMLDVIANRHWGEYAVPDRNFQLRYGLDGTFDALHRIEQRRQAEPPDLKIHFDFLTSQQENELRHEASHESERIGDKLSTLAYHRRSENAPKADEEMKKGGQLPSKQRKPTI